MRLAAELRPDPLGERYYYSPRDRGAEYRDAMSVCPPVCLFVCYSARQHIYWNRVNMVADFASLFVRRERVQYILFNC